MSERGPQGEALARRFLIRRGWSILATNWRGPGGELDIVALRSGVLAIVEVKTRHDGSALTDPVRHAQRGRLIATARAFVASRPRLAEANVRFDVIAIDADRRRPRITHLQGAFETDPSIDGSFGSNRLSSVYATDRNERR